ncbi:hypothetical protein FB567DRAFT_590881 [Paraphoma chrysanthemicola]|uniref:Homeobox domain-containing protein n=1 Tax=Paraphoma chrysanthemicola TaxID=798071 RepID=A0A8K0RAW7_9PLEO|nr:hypothetical protein FB567DRAFT_590881 [Paraphoma chrysanthemicola]
MASQHPADYSAGNCNHQSHDHIGAQLVNDEANNFFDFDAWAQMDQLIDPPWPCVRPDLDVGTAQFSFESPEFGLDSFNDLPLFEIDNCNGLDGAQTVDPADLDALQYVGNGSPPWVNGMEQDWLGVTNPDDEAPVDNSGEHQYGPIPDIPVHTALASANGIEMETVTPAEVHGSAANGISADLLETPTLPLSKRTRISKHAKDVLQTHFRANPYPNKEETLSLSKATKLTGRTIKTWFTNTRSRIKTMNRAGEVTSDVSTASLEALEKVSPSGSTSSLQRWLDTPINEDSVVSPNLLSPQEFPSIIQGLPSDLNVPRHDDSPGKSSPWLKSPALSAEHVARSYKASSVASSRSSRASDSSSISRCSFKSMDARGPRRGRKAWRRSQPIKKVPQGPDPVRTGGNGANTNPALGVKGKATTSSTGNEVHRRYFCTAQGCEARFMYPFEWLRHEEAIHYQPYHWICCLDTDALRLRPFPLCWICGELNVATNHFAAHHFLTCAKKEIKDRLFLREDQLLQHINGVHLNTRVSKPTAQRLLSSWKIDNPAFDKNILTCGFCGEGSETWEERYKHVSEHLRRSASKTAWRPEVSSFFKNETVHINTDGPVCGEGSETGEERYKHVSEHLRRSASKTAWRPEVSSLFKDQTVHINTDGQFNCPYCGICLENLQVASKEHAQCLTWSCRNLQDPQAVLNRDKRWRGSNHDDCRLCDYFRLYSSNDGQRFMEKMEHEKFHRLCDCDCEVYVRVDDFVHHLQSMHSAKTPLQSDLDPWKVQLSLKWQTGSVYMSESRRFGDSGPAGGRRESTPVGDR